MKQANALIQSHNISAHQIQLDNQRRRQQAEAAQNGTAVAGPSNSTADDDDDADAATAAAAAEVVKKDKKDKKRKANEKKAIEKKAIEKKAIEKIKASKKFQKRKKQLDGSDEEEELARQWLRTTNAPAPGQMENCEICSVRFTVTAYSRTGPSGGLLCTPCGKDLDKDAEPARKKKKKAPAAGPVGSRRKTQSSLLDGTYMLGAKSLMTLCIETLAKNIDLAEDLGDLPPVMVDKIARNLSKRRLLNPLTLNLFLQKRTEDVFVYDGAKLGSDDLMRIFQTVPNLKNIKIRNAIQFKDEVMEYLLSRDKIDLEGLYIHGANLLSTEMWRKYLLAKGKSLQKLQVYYTDKHFEDETLALLKTATPSLKRIKVCHNQAVSGDGILELANVKTLEHIGIQLHKNVHSDVYVTVINSIGKGLKTFSLRMTPDLDNTVLDAIHAKCRSLEKLRLTDSEVMTDAGFARLFRGWANPGLYIVDFQKCRHVDSTKPRENEHNVGLCSEGFKALMAHSGKTLRKLNVHACRHISREAFEEVFAPERVYPELKRLEISFCEEVTDFIVGSAFRSCPNLRELNVFGCMKVKDVVVPRGKILVGMPNAIGMVIEGLD